jgi:hypothetical protein
MVPSLSLPYHVLRSVFRYSDFSLSLHFGLCPEENGEKGVAGLTTEQLAVLSFTSSSVQKGVAWQRWQSYARGHGSAARWQRCIFPGPFERRNPARPLNLA